MAGILTQTNWQMRVQHTMEYLILHAEERCLTVAHFEVSRRSAELIGAATIELSDERTLTDAVRSVAAKMSGSPRIILCLPPSLFAQRRVALPFNDIRKVREVLPAHLQGESAVPVEELALGVLPAREGEFLAVWARKSDIGASIELFRDAGIEPQIVSSPLFSLAELPGVPADCALCDGTALAFMNSGRLTYFRAFNTPLTSAMVTATFSALELSGEVPPPCICMFGAGVALFGDAEALAVPVKKIEVPAELGRTFKNDETFQQFAGLYAVARAAFAGTLPDFRQGELAWTVGDATLRKKLILTGILTVAVLLLLFVYKGLQYRAVTADVASLNKSISGIYREVFPKRAKAVDEVSEIKGEIRKMAGVESTSSYLSIMKKIAEAKGSSINGLYEAELEGATLRIKGDAVSAQKVTELKTALSPLLASSELGEVKSRPDGTVSFSLTGTLKEGTK